MLFGGILLDLGGKKYRNLILDYLWENMIFLDFKKEGIFHFFQNSKKWYFNFHIVNQVFMEYNQWCIVQKYKIM